MARDIWELEFNDAPLSFQVKVLMTHNSMHVNTIVIATAGEMLELALRFFRW
jgi:hypothetical protein